jgi:hypothetical protein
MQVWEYMLLLIISVLLVFSILYQSGPDIWVLQKKTISPILVPQNFQKVNHNLVYLMLTLGIGDAIVSIIIYL